MTGFELGNIVKRIAYETDVTNYNDAYEFVSSEMERLSGFFSRLMKENSEWFFEDFEVSRSKEKLELRIRNDRFLLVYDDGVLEYFPMMGIAIDDVEFYEAAMKKARETLRNDPALKYMYFYLRRERDYRIECAENGTEPRER